MSQCSARCSGRAVRSPYRLGIPPSPRIGQLPRRQRQPAPSLGRCHTPASNPRSPGQGPDRSRLAGHARGPPDDRYCRATRPSLQLPHRRSRSLVPLQRGLLESSIPSVQRPRDDRACWHGRSAPRATGAKPPQRRIGRSAECWPSGSPSGQHSDRLYRCSRLTTGKSHSSAGIRCAPQLCPSISHPMRVRSSSLPRRLAG
jgi:hypothetical protein